MNIMINVFLALLFLSLGAASAALGVTVLSPSSQVVTRTSDFLSLTTAALSRDSLAVPWYSVERLSLGVFWRG